MMIKSNKLRVGVYFGFVSAIFYFFGWAPISDFLLIILSKTPVLKALFFNYLIQPNLILAMIINFILGFILGWIITWFWEIFKKDKKNYSSYKKLSSTPMKKAILILVIIAALVACGILYQYKFKNKDITYRMDYYSISVPADWKQEVNDLGAHLDQRLAGYTYNSPSVPISFDVFVYNNNGLDLKNYLKKKTYSDTYPPSPNRLSDGTISIDYKVVPSTSNHGEGVKEIIYSISRAVNSYTYYFGNSKYIYTIDVWNNASNVEMSTSAYNQLWQAAQPILDRVINSFTTKY